MMHKSLLPALAITAFTFASPQAQAQDYGMAGCGLGSMVLGSGGGIMQVVAATLNGVSGNQTFGITLGTSNCVESGVAHVDQEQEAFVASNLPYLRRDMAAGGGEYMAAFSELLGCSDSVKDELNQFAQDNFKAVFPTEETTSEQALYMFKLNVSNERDFAMSCTRI
ncbi:MAG: DUF3015 family protein [Myxococcota bacterium]|nr:DUF3015 family protein [Myxococcota bacterium]